MGVTTRRSSNGFDEIARVPLFRVSLDESLASPIDRRSAFYREQARELLIKKGTLKPQPMLTPPNLLTLARIVLVPAFVACWFGEHRHYSVATAALFIAASITDWLDGYLARRMKLTSAFGAFLDPVADKIMVSTALVLLATGPPRPISQAAMVVPVALIIAREITMSALREWAAVAGGAVHQVGGGRDRGGSVALWLCWAPHAHFHGCAATPIINLGAPRGAGEAKNSSPRGCTTRLSMQRRVPHSLTAPPPAPTPQAVKVSSLGKWKTALQMTAMSALLVLRNDHLVGDSARALAWVHAATLGAWATLVAATVLAVWSLANYMANVWHFFRYPTGGHAH
jgi:phosphatidylglycerophosphate synthase